MGSKVILKKFIDPPLDWDRNLLDAYKETNFCQSVVFSRIWNKVYNSIPLFFEVTYKNKLFGFLQISHTIPENLSVIKKIIGLNKGWIEWLDGPILLNNPYNTLDLLLKEIDNYCAQKKINLIKCNGFAHTSKYANDLKIMQVFLKNGYTVSKWATYLVDLTLDENELWANLKKTARKMVKKSNSLAVKVNKVNTFEELLDKFHKSYCETESFYGRLKKSDWIAKVQWEEDIDNNYHYYYAETQDGQVVGTLGMYIFNGVATEISSCLTPYAYENEIPAQDILHWVMFLEAKKMGCHTFDLAGINPNPTNEKERGIRRFKEKWNGQYIEYYTYKKTHGLLKIYTIIMGLIQTKNIKARNND